MSDILARTHEPTDACAGVHCHAHDVDEPGPYWRVRVECGHAFPTPEAPLADEAALVERLNAHPFDDGPAEPLTPTSDSEEIRACPHDL